MPMIIILILLLLIPTGVRPGYSLDKWDTYKAEGMVAFDINRGNKLATPVAPDDKPVTFPTNHPKTCICKGTGKVKSGDLIIDVPCPKVYSNGSIGEPAKAEVPVKAPAVVEAPVKPLRQVLFFTKTDCDPCKNFKAWYGDQLKREGFGFDDSEYSLIRVVDVYQHPDLYQLYAQSFTGIKYVPQFVVVENGKALKGTNPFVTQTAESVKGLLK